MHDGRRRRAAGDAGSFACPARWPRRKRPKSPPKSPAASIATPIERGSRVASGTRILIQIADAEVAAQAREADANAAQIEARLGTASGAAFEVERVAEVANARAGYELARTEFERTKMLQERQLDVAIGVRSAQAQVEAARRQYEVARNGAEQQYQALMGARARVAMARKARRRHHRARAVRRRRRRAAGVGRRLRDARHQGRVGHAREPAAPRADRAGAVRHRGRRRQRRRLSRSTPIRARRSSARSATSRRRCARTRARSSSRRSWPTPTAD